MNQSQTTITFSFHEDLKQLLRRNLRNDSIVTYPLTRRTSIKDILESFGVPHTEIGAILWGGKEVGFDYIPVSPAAFEIYPIDSQRYSFGTSLLHPEYLQSFKFMVDVNVAKLGSLLRMAGLDATMVPRHYTDRQIVQELVASGRFLLTRNKELLKIKAVIRGRLLRSQQAEQQLREIIWLLELHDQLKPFTRCMACNGLLEPVDKDTILDRLLPLTKKYYTIFKQCCSCKKIYWRGSHYKKMSAIIDSLQRIGGKR